MIETLKRYKFPLIILLAIILPFVVIIFTCDKEDTAPVKVVDNVTDNTSGAQQTFLIDYLTVQAEYASLQQAYTILEANYEVLQTNFNNLTTLPPSIVIDNSKAESMERDIISLHTAFELSDKLRLDAEQDKANAEAALVDLQDNYEIVIEDFNEIKAALHLIKNRGCVAVSGNLTAEEYAGFNKGIDSWWPTLPDNVK